MVSLKMVQTRSVFSWEKRRHYMMRRMTSISAEVLPMKVFKVVVDMLKMLWRLVISIQLGEEQAVHEGDDLHQ